MKQQKDIYIKNEGDFVTVIAMTDKAKQVFAKQEIPNKEKFDCELSDLHRVLCFAISHNLSTESEVTITIPEKNSNI